VLCGVKPESAADLKKAIQAGKVVQRKEKTMSLPASFESEMKWPQCKKTISDIRDQSACGCCWAFASAEAASDRLCITTNASIMVPLSAEDNCFCAESNGCGGGFLYAAWQYIQQSGLVTGGQYQGSGPFGTGYCSDFALPHCHHHGPKGSDPYPNEGTPGCPIAVSPACPTSCDAGASGGHNDFSSDKYTFTGQLETASGEQQIMQAIYEGGPVETGFSVYADFENYASGIYHHASGQLLGGHAVKFVGWGEENGVKYWKIANSWNPYWGETGYFRIRRGTDECGIEDQVVYAAANAQWGKKH